jgi:WD40 repeat protein
VAFSKDGKSLASCSSDKSVCVWNIDDVKKSAKSSTASKVFRGNSGSILAVAFSVDGNVLASAGTDECVKLWSLDSSAPLYATQGHSARVNKIAVSKGGGVSLLASAGGDWCVRFWDTLSLKEFAVVQAHEDSVSCVALSGDAQYLVSGAFDRTVVLYDV